RGFSTDSRTSHFARSVAKHSTFLELFTHIESLNLCLVFGINRNSHRAIPAEQCAGGTAYGAHAEFQPAGFQPTHGRHVEHGDQLDPGFLLQRKRSGTAPVSGLPPDS